MENFMQIKMAMPLLCKKVNNMLQAEYGKTSFSLF